MTLLGKIFRPWDLASNETFLPKSNESEATRNAETSKETFQNTRRKQESITTETDALSERTSARAIASKKEKTNHDFGEVNSPDLHESKSPISNPFKTEDSKSNSSNSGSTIAHFLEFNHSSVPPFYIPNSPIGTPTTSSFMSSSSINELASLSRSELTAMGLLPPEPPASMKVKRQRPKRFRCPHCQVAFSNNGQLRGHIRIHTGERPFSCEHEGCGKSFTRNEELTRHRRIHTGLRPYPCTHCGKKFGRKDHLKKHTRTHQRPMYNAPSGMIGLGNPFHPFNPSLIPSHSAINEFNSTASPYALPFMLSMPPPIPHFPFS